MSETKSSTKIPFSPEFRYLCAGLLILLCFLCVSGHVRQGRVLFLWRNQRQTRQSPFHKHAYVLEKGLQILLIRPFGQIPYGLLYLLGVQMQLQNLLPASLEHLLEFLGTDFHFAHNSIFLLFILDSKNAAHFRDIVNLRRAMASSGVRELKKAAILAAKTFSLTIST